MTDEERMALPVEVSTSVKDAGPWAKSLGVTIPAEEVEKEFGAVAGELAGAIQLPGFRPGKVPRNVVEKRFGDDIKKQVTANLITRGLRCAVVKEKLDVIGEPHIPDAAKFKASRGEPLTFNVDVEVRPTFELGTYKGLAIEQEEIEVLPEEIEAALQRVRERYAVQSDAPADHAVVESDTAKGVLRFLVDGNEVHKQEDAELEVMQGHVLGAFAHLGSQFLVGAKAGDKRTVEETLAGNFPVEAQRGKKATIEFELKSISIRNLPPVDDELAEKVKMKNLDDLKEKVRSSLLDNIRDEIERRTRQTLLDKVLETTPFELPTRLLDHMATQSLAEQHQYLQQMGVTLDLVKDKAGEFAEAAKKSAVAEMRKFFILDAICTKENIGVDDDDVDQELVRMARQRSMKASDLYDRLVESGQIKDVEHGIKTRKAVEFLVENADIKIVPRKPLKVDEVKHDHAAHAPNQAQAHGHGHDADADAGAGAEAGEHGQK